MIIAIVINTSWNIYNFRLGLIKALQENNHTVYAIAPEDPYSAYLVKEGCKFIDIKIENTGKNPFQDLLLTYRLFKIYRQVKPDLILHYTIKPNIYGTIAAKILKIKTINNVSGLGTVFLENKFSSKLARILYRFAFKFPDKVFFQNSEDRDFFVNDKLIKKEKSGLLPGSGINVQHFRPADIPHKNKKFTFILISRLIKDKGIEEYVKAAKLLKEKGVMAQFQLLGTLETDHNRGIKEKELANWINNDWIKYLGSVRDVRPYIHHSDCVVLPSYREGTPRSLLEAAGCAKPIVATDVAGCRNVVHHGINGFLCKPKDFKDLANKMLRVYGLREDKLHQMGQNGRDLILQSFDEKIIIFKYFKEIIKLFPSETSNFSLLKDIHNKIVV